MIPNPEYDKPGYCAKCHEAIAEFDGANNIVRINGNAAEAWFTLDDKSKMRVMLCIHCKQNLKPEDTIHIMDSVYKGWVFECETLVERGIWDKVHRDNYLDLYSERHIVARKDDVAWKKSQIESAIGKNKMGGVKFQESLKNIGKDI
jgi:hypothetical protein